MPIYETICKKCGQKDTVFRKIVEYNNLPECCGEMVSRVISAPFVPQEFRPYRSMIDGRMITDRGEHRRHLKANGCTEIGNEDPTPKVDHFKIKRNKQQLRESIAQHFN